MSMLRTVDVMVLSASGALPGRRRWEWRCRRSFWSRWRCASEHLRVGSLQGTASEQVVRAHRGCEHLPRQRRLRAWGNRRRLQETTGEWRRADGRLEDWASFLNARGGRRPESCSRCRRGRLRARPGDAFPDSRGTKDEGAEQRNVERSGAGPESRSCSRGEGPDRDDENAARRPRTTGQSHRRRADWGGACVGTSRFSVRSRRPPNSRVETVPPMSAASKAQRQ